MPKAKNIAVAEEIKEKFSRAKSLILSDYSGLTHKQLEDLHKKVKAVGAEFIVVKNSLLKIASSHQTTGPTAILLAYEDALAPLKEIYKTVKVKMGVIDGVTYDAAEIGRLAALPSREILLGQFVYTLTANLQKLVYILDQVKSQK